MKSSPGLDFVGRTLRTTGYLILIFLPFGFFYLGVYPTLAIFSGCVWGIVNILFITRLVKVTIRPGGVDGFHAIAWGILKFPLLYLAGYFLLKVPYFEPLYLLIGFTSILAVMVLKVIGRAILDMDNVENKNEKLQRTI